MTVDLSFPQSVHVVGIGGAGMSTLATVLSATGHHVSGSDLKASPVTDRLAADGIGVEIGHRRENIRGAGGRLPDIVTRSSAVGDSNLEVAAARDAGIPVFSRAEVLAAVCRLRRTLAIAGTHGKTTTTSMLGLILREAGLDPSFLVGGEVNEIGSGALWGEGPWLVVEADESDGTFLSLAPEAAVVTSTDVDHLSYYGTEETFRASFAEFLESVAGFRLVFADEEWGRSYAAGRQGVLTYGCSEGADLRVVEAALGRSAVEFTILESSGGRARLRLPQPGLHNALNATCAAACARELGVPIQTSARILESFGGVSRRYEFRGAARGVTFIDDYAHLPGEVERVLQTARAGEWDRVVCVFQPHRFSRISHLHRDFANSFKDADFVVITDIYGAGEKPLPGVSGKLVLDALLGAEPRKRAGWFPHRRDLIEHLRRELSPGDVCLTLNAGDLTTLPDELMARLER